MRIFIVIIGIVLSTLCGLQSAYGKSSSATSGNLPVEFKGWFYQEDVRGRGMEAINCFSENFVVVNGRKIALTYGVNIWPYSSVSETLYSCGFVFSDVTDILDNKPGSTDTTSKLPKFAPYSKIKKLTIVWLNNNTTTSLKIGNVLNNTIIVFNPYSTEFQKKLNRNKKFKVTVETTTGRKLDYYFNLSGMEPLPTL